MPKSKTLISIVGPTAIGKTEMAIKIAEHFNTEIISADSRQFYRELEIGTAKPSENDLSKIPHHFINNKSIIENYSAGEFERDALIKINSLFELKNYVLMVGGSGLYVKALWEGLHTLPQIDNNLREEIIQFYAKNGIEGLQTRLKKIDAVRYQTIDQKNPQRLMRAIEIATTVGKEFEEIIHSKKSERDFKIVKIGLNTSREKLYERINQRVDQMIEKGLIKECENVMNHKSHYALQTVGYSEIFEYFEGKNTLEKAIELIKQHTRNYAKRQVTWFTRDKEITWFEPTDFEQIMNHIKNFSKL